MSPLSSTFPLLTLISNSAMLTILASATGCYRLCLVGVLYIKTPTWSREKLDFKISPKKIPIE